MEVIKQRNMSNEYKNRICLANLGRQQLDIAVSGAKPQVCTVFK